MEESKEKEERKTRWYKAHTDDYTRPEAVRFLDLCETQKIPELAAIGFIEKIRRAMMTGTGKLTAREIRNLSSKGVDDVLRTEGEWKDWLAMAAHFHVLETIQAVEEGETFVYYTDPEVQTAYRSATEDQENGGKGGRKRAENARKKAERRQKKRDRERDRYWKNKAQKAREENGQATLEQTKD